MNFASDNTAPAHPSVMQALAAANEGYVIGYGTDAGAADVQDQLRQTFEAPDAVVRLVPTGTAANALALATLVPPYGAIYCHRRAHINVDECGAPEFYTGGAKLVPLDGDHARLTPEALRAAITGTGTVHSMQPAAVSLTNLTEMGAAYTPAEIAALSEVAHQKGLKVHLDGARFANAMVAQNASPAEASWRAGVDVLSFGGTKNGLMGAEAVIFFDPAHAWEFELRRKRAGHLFSKHRYLAAQMQAYLADDLWLTLARHANAMASLLADGLRAKGVEIANPVDGNMIFAHLPEAMHERLKAAGASYYAQPELRGVLARLVTSWCTTDADVNAFLSAA